MPEISQIAYSFKELAELLIKDQGKHEGYWGVYVRFGIGAANAGASATDLRPTALVPVVEIGLQRFDDLNNLSVDAAVVNPRPDASKKEKAAISKARKLKS
ncbi:MAG: hypothetical protein SF097_12285 [Acidobacteriota bacterium]|nr:hypothetical protein [Acidobacteriota bacterium]